MARIGFGMVVLLGVAQGDIERDAEFLADRIVGMRIFADTAGKMNLAAPAAGAAILVVSQFTLIADTSQRRPSFIQAAAPDEARLLYQRFILFLKKAGVSVEQGRFGTYMEVTLVNDGPVTIVVDSRNR